MKNPSVWRKLIWVSSCATIVIGTALWLMSRNCGDSMTAVESDPNGHFDIVGAPLGSPPPSTSPLTQPFAGFPGAAAGSAAPSASESMPPDADIEDTDPGEISNDDFAGSVHPGAAPPTAGDNPWATGYDQSLGTQDSTAEESNKDSYGSYGSSSDGYNESYAYEGENETGVSAESVAPGAAAPVPNFAFPTSPPGPSSASAPDEPQEAAEPEQNADDIRAEVDRKLAALSLGNIAFNTPETIPLGDAATIELLVSLKETEDQLRAAVQGVGPVATARVKLSNKMEARLTGLGFSIEAITPEQQVISSSERTQWQWQIEPKKSDQLELHLTLSALITVDGQPSARAIRTFERTIYVEVPIVQRVANVLSNNVELITSALLIPVAGGAYRHYRKKKRRTLPPNDSTPTRKAA